MKLNAEKRTITTSGNFPKRKSQIVANAQAYEILSSRIYTDAKLAIVRELSTNAYDAHVDAGNADKPFDIHLPNALTPHFSIRDYGTGIAPEKMENVYMDYFKSTRGESNEFVGALGLGSKSPLSYTDQFAVTSWVDGVQYDYSIYKDEDGAPTTAQLNVSESDEPNGVKIEIAVQDYHHYDFVTAAEKVYRFFKVRPNITGREVTINEAEPIVSGDGFDLYNFDAGIRNTISVVMGQVHYKVNEDKFSHSVGYSGRLVIHAEIGDVSISASREELYYDDTTNDWLTSAVKESCKKASAEFQKEITGTPTKLAEIQLMSRYRNMLSFDMEVTRIDCVADAYEMKRLTLRGGKLYIGRDDRWLEPNMQCSYVFIECDVEKLTQKLKGRIRRFLEENGGQQYFLITVKDAAVTKSVFGEPTAKITDLPDAIRKNGGGAGGPRCSFKRLTYGGGRISECWDNDDKDDDLTGGCAVPRKGYRVIWGGTEQRPDGWIDIATTVGFTNVYGLTAGRYEKARESLGLPDLEEAAKEWITKEVAGWSKVQRYLYHSGDTYYSYRSEQPCKELIAKMAGLSDECDGIIEFMKTEKESRTVRRLISLLNIDVPKHDMESPTETFYKKYPLAESKCDTLKMVDELIIYITAKEAQAKPGASI